MSTVESGMKMTTNALAGWFGANRILAEAVGAMMGECEHVVVPFAGGCCELKYIKARTIIVNDRHSHLVNLARVVANPVLCPQLMERLDGMLFHPDVLAQAQNLCKLIELEAEDQSGLFPASQKFQVQLPARQLEWAEAFFVACWMGRGGLAGTDGEFNGSLSLRWDAGGGDSNTRFRSAVASQAAWHKILVRCNFTCEDFRDVLRKTKDRKGHGIYADAPWPDAGDGYKHKFFDKDQRDLAAMLAAFKETRVVVRFGVHALIEELYPRNVWHWTEQTSRCQHNADVMEALICNFDSTEGKR